MPSVNTFDICKKIIDNNGYYEDDNLCLQVAKYTNSWGGTTYHLAYNLIDIKSLYESPFCKDIEILWRHNTVKEIIL